MQVQLQDIAQLGERDAITAGTVALLIAGKDAQYADLLSAAVGAVAENDQRNTQTTDYADGLLANKDMLIADKDVIIAEKNVRISKIEVQKNVRIAKLEAECLNNNKLITYMSMRIEQLLASNHSLNTYKAALAAHKFRRLA